MTATKEDPEYWTLMTRQYGPDPWIGRTMDDMISRRRGKKYLMKHYQYPIGKGVPHWTYSVCSGNFVHVTFESRRREGEIIGYADACDWIDAHEHDGINYYIAPKLEWR